MAENTAAGQAIGNPVVAEDEDGDILTYTLTGDTGADDFLHRLGHGPVEDEERIELRG